MPEIPDGGVVQVQGSAKDPYELKNIGGVFSCTCPAWRNQSTGLDRRTCKHLKSYRGEAAEKARIEAAIAANPDAPDAQRARDAVNATPRAAAVKRPGGLPPGGGPGAKPLETRSAPPVLLAHRWENDVDLTGWWMSEKLDGVRAYWDGKAFVSRLGNAFAAPKWFVEGLPSHPLDGELWVGRKMFQETMSIVRRFDMSDDWKRVKYVLFDAPAHGGPFEERYEFLMKSFAEGRLPFCRALPQEKVRDMKHLKDELARVESLGGEGLMVRQPGSTYVAARSSTLLKIKSFFDAEGKVVGHLPGTGKHKGRLGALDVEMTDGTRFHVGTGFSDAEREDPPAIGAIVTFRYQELSKDGVPRFPSYVGIRDDISWEQAGAKPDAARKAVNPKNPQGVTTTAKKKEKVAVAVPPAPRVAQTATAGGAPAAKRHFEFKGGTASKFWEIAVDGARQIVTYGRIGTSGQSKLKEFADTAAAQRAGEKLIAEKLAEGYVEGAWTGAPKDEAKAAKR